MKTMLGSVDIHSLQGDINEIESIMRYSTQTPRFDHFAYLFLTSTPITAPRIAVFTTFPYDWIKEYCASGFIDRDNFMKAAHVPGQYSMWTESSFASAPRLHALQEAHGIKAGITVFVRQVDGVLAFILLARKAGEINKEEVKLAVMDLLDAEPRLRVRFTRTLSSRKEFFPNVKLSRREVDVLRYTADGATADEISKFMFLASSTVNFHIKAAIRKLEAKNKTEATLKAALWGLI